jgi:hypothetical protein
VGFVSSYKPQPSFSFFYGNADPKLGIPTKGPQFSDTDAIPNRRPVCHPRLCELFGFAGTEARHTEREANQIRTESSEIQNNHNQGKKIQTHGKADANVHAHDPN